MTQAVSAFTKLRVVGNLRHAGELFHRIALAIGEPRDAVRCEYAA